MANNQYPADHFAFRVTLVNDSQERSRALAHLGAEKWSRLAIIPKWFYLYDTQYQMECKQSQGKLTKEDKHQNTESEQISHILQIERSFLWLRSALNLSHVLNWRY